MRLREARLTLQPARPPAQQATQSRPYMADHVLGAATYAIKAVHLASVPGDAKMAGESECRWQREHLPEAIREFVLSDEERCNHKFWSVFT